jgi:hypothetical protein
MAELSEMQLELLRRLAGRMIPASPAHEAPGADDPAIFQEVAAALQARAAILDGLLTDLAGGAIDELGSLRQKHEAAFAIVIAAVAQAYYRDDRVMRSLGMEPRPPFPKGYEVREGDWALLDAVRRRTPIWRDAGSNS